MLRGVRGFAVTLTALALLATAAGCGGAGGAGGKAEAAEPPPVLTDSSQSASATPSAARSAAPTSAPPSVRPSAARSTTPTRRPTPTQKPQIPLPPPPNQPQVPPPSTSTSGATCPSYAGPKAPVADVKAALTIAAGTPYWSKVTDKPDGYTGDGSEIRVPLNLIKAVAWQESGWQSTIIACDGGIGTMQVMPGTADWMNQRFRTSHNVNTLAGNTALGAEYLEWLIMYFGLYYFGSFDLSIIAPVGVGGANMRLRDVVIAGYNVGPGALENPDDTLEIPNQRYVDNVVALMSNCVCLSY